MKRRSIILSTLVAGLGCVKRVTAESKRTALSMKLQEAGDIFEAHGSKEAAIIAKALACCATDPPVGRVDIIPKYRKVDGKTVIISIITVGGETEEPK